RSGLDKARGVGNGPGGRPGIARDPRRRGPARLAVKPREETVGLVSAGQSLCGDMRNRLETGRPHLRGEAAKLRWRVAQWQGEIQRCAWRENSACRIKLRAPGKRGFE